MWDQLAARYDYTPADILSLLKDAGFTVYRILDSGTHQEITSAADFSRLQNYLATRTSTR